MDLITFYMGLKLKNPLVASASPLSEDLDTIRLMEDVGIGAIVHYCLFQEETERTPEELRTYIARFSQGFPPEPELTSFGPDEYCEHLRRAKEAVDIPIIGSLNGYTAGDWIKVARLIEQAGADALELNLYRIPTDPQMSGREVEKELLEVSRSVKSLVSIPVAVKLSPFFSALGHLTDQLDEAGADGLVIFNRFYQPDIDLSTFTVYPHLVLSTSDDLRLPLHWIALVFGRVRASLAATSGIHSVEDVIKMLLAGADVTMLCSTLIQNGIGHTRSILEGLARWLEEWGYPSVAGMRGMMSRKSYRDPEVFERANYMKALRTYGRTYR